MNRTSYRGVSASEYALILGLVGVLAIAGLSLFGQNTATLLGKANQGGAHSQMKSMVDMRFNGGGSGGGLSGGSYGVGQTLGKSAGNGTLGGLNVSENGNSGGTNVSSAEGTSIHIGSPSLNTSLETAKALDLLANSVTDPGVKTFLTDTRDRAYWLAGSQGTFEVSGTSNNNSSLQKLANTMGLPDSGDINNSALYRNNALKSIDIWSGELVARREQLVHLPNLSPTQKAEALRLMDNMLTATQTQYGNMIQSNRAAVDASPGLIQPTNGTVQMEALKTIAGTAATNGDLAKTPAIQSSVAVGQTLGE